MEEHEQKVAVLEGCRSSVDQEASTLRGSMRELEKSRLQARRELQELRRQVKKTSCSCGGVTATSVRPSEFTRRARPVAPPRAGEAPGGRERALSAGGAGAAGPAGSGGAEGGGGTAQGVRRQEASPRV